MSFLSRHEPMGRLPKSRELTELYALMEARFAKLNPANSKQILTEVVELGQRLAETALAEGQDDVYQTTRSIISFLESMVERRMGEQDRLQIRLLVDNLRRELFQPSAPEPTSALVARIASTSATTNPRIALYIESRAITALLQEALRQAGYLPQLLTSMQDLEQATIKNYPAAIVADLSLCQRDTHTRNIIQMLRERFSQPPHLFCLAGADDVKARLQAVRLGATRFLKKPVDAGQLIDILKGVTVQSPSTPFRVLFVDDDRSLTSIYAAAMQDIGVEVQTLNDPLAAPPLVNEFVPDVIVTDLYMPGCNGFELAAMLRQDDLLADTPILFLSSETGIHRQMAALDLGADDFLTKPVEMEVLQSAVIARAKRAHVEAQSAGIPFCG